MKDWFHRMLFGYDSFGELIFNYFIILLLILFCWSLTTMILNVLIHSIIEKKRKWNEKKYGYDINRELKYVKIEEKLENIFQLKFGIRGKISENLKMFFLEKLKIDLNEYKSFIQWFIGFLVITSIWINWEDPFNDFMLITKGIEVNGVITKSEQESEIVEINDGRSRREEFNFTYQYSYHTKDGNKYDGTENVKGEQPDEFYNLEEEPIDVKVTYLEQNPKYSRVFKYTSNNKNLLDWFKYTILYLIILSFWSYLILKSL